MWITGGALAVAVVAGGAGLAVASGSGDDPPITGVDQRRAERAALAATGGGTVLETEAGDDGAAFGVEVRLADGSTVEVHLDQTFRVIGQEADDDSGGGEDGS
jgi:hypothetical protein